jgi:hypothetical protein
MQKYYFNGGKTKTHQLMVISSNINYPKEKG